MSASTKKPIPPPIETSHQPGPVTPPPRAAAAGAGSAETAHSQSSPPMTPPVSPGYASPTFSSEQHAKKAKPHVCFRCHPECMHDHEHNFEGDEPHTPTKLATRRRSSAGSSAHGHRDAVQRHLGMEGKCTT